MAAKKAKLRKSSSKNASPKLAKKAPAPQDVNPVTPAVLPPVEEEESKTKDEFFDEEEMKEFSVKDEEEDTDEESGGGQGEPAWDEEEY